MKNNQVVKIYKLRFLLNIGFGYWRDKYIEKYHGTDGNIHHIILPLCKIEVGRLIVPSKKVVNDKHQKENELRKRIKSNRERRGK